MRFVNWFLALISSAILLTCPLGATSYAAPKIKIVPDMGVPIVAPKGKDATIRRIVSLRKILKGTNKKAKRLERSTAELIKLLKELKARQKARAKAVALPKDAKS